jgi:hypothetical protein
MAEAAEQIDAALAASGDAWLRSSPTGKHTPACRGRGDHVQQHVATVRIRPIHEIDD